MRYFPIDTYHEGVCHQIFLDHKVLKFNISCYVLFVWSNGRLVDLPKFNVRCPWFEFGVKHLLFPWQFLFCSSIAVQSACVQQWIGISIMWLIFKSCSSWICFSCDIFLSSEGWKSFQSCSISAMSGIFVLSWSKNNVGVDDHLDCLLTPYLFFTAISRR